MFLFEYSLVFLSWFSSRHRSMRFFWHDLRLLRGLRRVMNHGVGILDTDTVSTGLRSKQFHECVVVFLSRPVALPFEAGPRWLSDAPHQPEPCAKVPLLARLEKSRRNNLRRRKCCSLRRSFPRSAR